ncbi:MAG: hypothetical protein RIQ68_2305 [Pseudomonadota bacterium]|jgi:hypothetical protein
MATLPFFNRRHLLLGTALVAGSAGFPRLAFAASFDPFAQVTSRGPSSRDVPAVGTTPAATGAPYLSPVAKGWHVVSLLTTGNDVNGYRMSGIPDGLGAFDNGDHSITILMNHELAGGKGADRAHGGKGAFVSRWRLDKDSLQVVAGQDFLSSPSKLHLWTGDAWKSGDQVPAKLRDFNRFCSADLAPVSGLYHAPSGLGYQGRIFLNGEEGGGTNANRAFAFIAETGEAYELPGFAFGTPNDEKNLPPSWENVLVNPVSSEVTVVAANSDGGSNQVYFYIGRKSREGSPVERAGLAGGKIYALSVPGVSAENRNTNIGLEKSRVGQGAGKPVGLSDVNKGTSFQRPEDGVWDPRNPNRFYFVTTDRNNFAADGTVRDGQDVTQIGRSRLWAVTFDDVTKMATDGSPVGRIEMLLDGTEGGDMFDNVTIDDNGVLYLCEDPGNSRHNGKIWSYDSRTGAFEIVTKFDPALFGDVVSGQYSAPAAPFVDDKETSGITDVTDLFKNATWYRPGARVLLVVVQAHFVYDASQTIGQDLVEGGQLLLLVKDA